MAAGKKFKDQVRFWGFYIGVFTLLVICVVSMYRSFIENSGVDFTLFFSCTYAAVRGWDFFDVNNLIFYEWEEALMVMPGLLLFFIPLLLFDIHIARLIYFLAGLGATIFCYLWMFRLTGLLKKVDFRKPNINTILFFCGGFVLLNSSPVLMCLRNGQMTIWVMLLLVLFSATNNRYWRTVFFGLAAVCKYSMVTFFAPLLFIKKQYFICFAAFTVFLLVSMWPALAGYNLINLYIRYAQVIMNTLNSGCNSFQLAGHDMLQFGYFLNPVANLLGKLFFTIAMLFIFWRERNKPEISLNLLMLVFCLTMLVSYHRLYDNVILVLLLVIKTNFLVIKKDWRNSFICTAFLLYYLMPVSWIFMISNYLGGNVVWLQNVFHVSPYAQHLHVLPVIAFSQTFLGLYILYLYLKTEDDYVFKLER